MNERLYRSRSDRMIAGVAGGLAEIWNLDPSLVRIVWGVLVPLTGFIALLVYVVMAMEFRRRTSPLGSAGWLARPRLPAAGGREAGRCRWSARERGW